MDSHLSSKAIPQILITPDKRSGMQETVGRVMASSVPISKDSAVLSASHATEGGKPGFWGRDGFTFGDLLDFINPLQHIPVVSTIYRAITGDEIGIGPRMIGGAALGGIIGLGLSTVNAAMEYETGKDVGSTVLASLGITGKEAIQVAANPSSDSIQIAENAEAAAALPVSLSFLQKNRSDIKSLRVLDNPHQQYRQAQAMDKLHQTALKMQI